MNKTSDKTAAQAQTEEPAAETDTGALEREANAVRERLAATLSRIETRGRAYADPERIEDRARVAVTQHKGQLALGALAAVAVAGVVGGIAYLRTRNKRRRLMQRRLDAVVRAWKNPDELVAARPSFFASVARNLLMAAVGTAARRLVQDLLPPMAEARPAAARELPAAKVPPAAAPPLLDDDGPRSTSPAAPI